MIRDLHNGLTWVYILANAAVGIWALAAHNIERVRHVSGWYAIGVAQAVIIAQVILGVILQTQDDIEPGEHQLYGFAAFLSIGIIFAYRNEMPDRPYLLYGFGSLWLMGLGLRAAFLVEWF